VPSIGDYVYTVDEEKFCDAFAVIEKQKTRKTGGKLEETTVDRCQVFVVAQHRFTHGYMRRAPTVVRSHYPCYSSYHRPPTTKDIEYLISESYFSGRGSGLSRVALETWLKQTVELSSATEIESDTRIKRRRLNEFDDPSCFANKFARRQLHHPGNPAEIALREAWMIWMACRKFYLFSV
jgi:hypothetical protein